MLEKYSKLWKIRNKIEFYQNQIILVLKNIKVQIIFKLERSQSCVHVLRKNE